MKVLCLVQNATHIHTWCTGINSVLIISAPLATVSIHRNTCWKLEEVFSKMGKKRMQWQTTLQCKDYEGTRKPSGAHGEGMLVRLAHTTHVTLTML